MTATTDRSFNYVFVVCSLKNGFTPYVWIRNKHKVIA